jgi:hypothetical protein
MYLAELKGLKVEAADVGNVYLEAYTKESSTSLQARISENEKGMPWLS